ncbi:MAG TPA: transcriptional repressor [Sedimentisphaerales bacterium]|nr:transcriptional repressor [Sedimentisphaerales bacterium]
MAKLNPDSQARTMLKAAKLYCTPGRVSILKVLLKAGKPLSHDEVARRAGPGHFDKVTIYRTLASLLEVGLVHRVFMDKRARHYELAHHCTEHQCHPHFTCTSCGDTHCLTEISLPMAKSPHKGFIIHRQQVRLEGLCPGCA